jgi:ribosomal protein L40E
MANSSIDYKQLVEAWLEIKEDDRCSKPTQHDLYSARTQICKRWNLNSVADIPRKRDNSVNISTLIDVILKNNSDTSVEEAIATFDLDGLTLKKGSFYAAKHNFKKKSKEPRARFVGEEGFVGKKCPECQTKVPTRQKKCPQCGHFFMKLRTKTQTKDQTKDQTKNPNVVEYVEKQLDALLAQVNQLDEMLMKDLLQARRRASALLLQ